MYIGLHILYPLFLSKFSENLLFSSIFAKIFKYSFSWKSDPWEVSYSVNRWVSLTERGHLIFKERLSILSENKREGGVRVQTQRNMQTFVCFLILLEVEFFFFGPVYVVVLVSSEIHTVLNMRRWYNIQIYKSRLYRNKRKFFSSRGYHT